METQVADSPAFDWTCEELERKTDLDRLESRGTVRIALKRSGFDVTRILPSQMRVVIERMLPGELEARGVEDADGVCTQLAERVELVDAGPVDESPDDVFRRLGGH
jgi:hypothetical protein